MSRYSFDIDPLAVLGVPADASLELIRDAYRRKSKLHHPDAGGEEWAFKVLVQSYEMLSSARVLRAARAEPASRRAPTGTFADDSTPGHGRSREPSADAVRGGIHDQDLDPSRIVGVEHLCVRYLWEDAAYLYLAQKHSDEERFLSCSLNLSWPDRDQAHHVDPDEAALIVADLAEVFDHMVVSTRVVTSRSHSDDHEFRGWLSYSGFDVSWKSLKALHDELRDRGLGLRQWSRDLFIPRTWS